MGLERQEIKLEGQARMFYLGIIGVLKEVSRRNRR